MDAFRNELAGLETRISRFAEERDELDRDAAELRTQIAEQTKKKIARPNYFGRTFAFLVCAALAFVVHVQILRHPTPPRNPAAIEATPMPEMFQLDGKLVEFKVEAPYTWKLTWEPGAPQMKRQDVRALAEIAQKTKAASNQLTLLNVGGRELAVGDQGTILVRASNGDWRREEIDGVKATPVEGIRAVMKASFDRWIAVGDRGLILERALTDLDQPSIWTPAGIRPPIESSLRALIVSDGRTFAIGDRGTFLREERTEKSGRSSWSVILIPTNEDLVAGIATNGGMFVLGSRAGTILTYRAKENVFSADYTSVNEPIAGFAMFHDQVAVMTKERHVFVSGPNR